MAPTPVSRPVPFERRGPFFSIFLALILLIHPHQVAVATAQLDTLSIRSGDVRVVFPSKQLVDTAKADLIFGILRSQQPFPGLESVDFRAPVTISLIRGKAAGQRAHSIPNIGTIVFSLDDIANWNRRELRSVLRHELAHLVLYQARLGQPVPHWFEEGYAEWAAQSLTCARELRLRVAIQLVGEVEAFGLDQVGTRGNGLGYELAYTMIQTLALSPGVLEKLLSSVGEMGFARAFGFATGGTLDSFERSWRVFLDAEYGTLEDDFQCHRSHQRSSDRGQGGTGEPMATGELWQVREEVICSG